MLGFNGLVSEGKLMSYSLLLLLKAELHLAEVRLIEMAESGAPPRAHPEDMRELRMRLEAMRRLLQEIEIVSQQVVSDQEAR